MRKQSSNQAQLFSKDRKGHGNCGHWYNDMGGLYLSVPTRWNLHTVKIQLSYQWTWVREEGVIRGIR
jgi:hypothetical protein